MEKDLEEALEHADNVIQSVQQRPPERKCSASGERSLHDKLYDIYVEECGKEPEVMEELTSRVNLLEKLVMRESLSCLVVNLYPGKEGYSLMLKGEDESYSETIRLPYEERVFLEYLDAQELPPVLVDLLEKCPVNMFHSGCVIAEIRDYRECSNMEAPVYQRRYILLRPTMQTLVSDVESIASNYPEWTQEDKLELERQLILATAEPLCLDPSVSVACIENRLLYNRQKMNTYSMRKNFERYSMASLNRQQEQRDYSQPPEPLRAWTSYKRSKESEAGQQGDLTISEAGKCVDTWKQRPCELEVPSEVDVERHVQGERFVQYDDSEAIVWPDREVKDASGFGLEAGDPYQTAHLPYMQTLNDPFISGRKSPCKEARHEREVPPCHSSTADYTNIFMPGSKTDTERLVSQSEELVQKDTKYQVMMSHRSSGSATLGQYSPGEEAERPQAMAVQSAVQRKGIKREPPATSVGPAVLGKGVKRAPPAMAVWPGIPTERVKSAPSATAVGPAVPAEGVKSAPPAMAVWPGVPTERVKSAPSATAVGPAVPAERIQSAPPAMAVGPAVPAEGVKSAPPATAVWPEVPTARIQSAPPASAVGPAVPTERIRSAPPAMAVGPAVPAEGVKSTPPAIAVWPEVPAARIQSAPPAKVVGPAVPAEGVKSAPPAIPVWPEVPAARIQSALPGRAVGPAVPAERIQSAPPAMAVGPAVPAEGVKSAPPAIAVWPEVPTTCTQSTPLARAVGPAVPSARIQSAPPAMAVRPAVPAEGVKRAPPAIAVWPEVSTARVQSAPPATAVGPAVPTARIQSALPAMAVGPAVPAEGIKSAPPAIAVWPEVPAALIQRSPPATAVGPAVPAEGVKRAPPAIAVWPEVSTARVQSAPPATAVGPAVPAEGVKRAPPAIAVWPEVSTARVQSAPPATAVGPAVPTARIQSALPAMAVGPAVPAEGIKSALPVVVVWPEVPAARIQSAPLAMAVRPAVPVEGAQSAPPTTTLPSSSGKSSSAKFTPQPASRFPKTKYRPIAAQPSVPQQYSAEVKQVSTVPVATITTATSPLRMPVTQFPVSSAGLHIIEVVTPVPGTQTVVRVSSPVQGSTPVALTPAGVIPSSLRSEGLSPNAPPAEPQAPSQTGVQVVLQPASGLRPFTVLQVPELSLILNTQQQAPQQPQQVQQQWFYSVIPQQLQQPTGFYLQQPMSQVSSAESSTSQTTMSLPTQQAVFVNISGMGSFLQPQTTLSSQLGSVQMRPEQTIPQQRALLPSAFQQQPPLPPQPQQVQLRILPHVGAVTTAVTQTGQPQQDKSQSTASQSKGRD